MFFMEKTMKMDDLGGNLPPFEWPKTARTSAELCFDQLCAWPTATVVWG